jgi:hypothetical protein
MKVQQLVNYNSQTAVVNLPHNKYIDRVLRSNSAPVLLERFADAVSPSKEISESYAAFSNLKKVCQVSDFTWLHIGDGAYTRTAAIFSFFCKSMNISIDPSINVNKFIDWKMKYDVKNMEIFAGIFKHFERSNRWFFRDVKEKYSICCVHAHVNLKEVDRNFPDWEYLYTNPCCNPHIQMFSEKYMTEKSIVKIVDRIDLGISSHERKVVIYKKSKKYD